MLRTDGQTDEVEGIKIACIIKPVYKYLLREATNTVKILKFGTPQTIAIIVLKIEKFD